MHICVGILLLLIRVDEIEGDRNLPDIKPSQCIYRGNKIAFGQVVEETYEAESNACHALKCMKGGVMEKITTPNCRRDTTLPTTTLAGCFPRNSLLSSRRKGNWCYGTYCDEYGKIVYMDKFDCRTAPITRQTSAQPTHTPYTTISSGCSPRNSILSSGRSGNWCYWEYCDENGELILSDDFSCGSTSTFKVPSTTPPSTTTPPGCFPRNSIISSGRSGSWCYWEYCDENGEVIFGDNFNCGSSSTSTPPPTTTSTTEPPTTMPPGCFPRNSIIGNERVGCWCYSVYCDENGELMLADFFTCGSGFTSTSPPTTEPPTTIPPGCFPRNSMISSGQSGNWCYWEYCDENGEVIVGDNFNCGSSSTSTPPTTTTSTTEPPTTTPPGCFPRNSMISSGQSGNWCYWEYCDENGEVIAGDDFNCGSSSTSTPPTTTTSTTEPPTTMPPGCFPRNSIIGNERVGSWCFSVYCDENGEVMLADFFTCGSSFTSTSPPTTEPPTTTPTGCFPRNSIISSGRSENWCYWEYCDENGEVILADDFNCGSTFSSTNPPTTTITPQVNTTNNSEM